MLTEMEILKRLAIAAALGAAVGLAVGLGFIYGALVATFIGYVVLVIFWQFEKRLVGKQPGDHYDRLEEREEK